MRWLLWKLGLVNLIWAKWSDTWHLRLVRYDINGDWYAYAICGPSFKDSFPRKCEPNHTFSGGRGYSYMEYWVSYTGFWSRPSLAPKLRRPRNFWKFSFGLKHHAKRSFDV